MGIPARRAHGDCSGEMQLQENGPIPLPSPRCSVPGLTLQRAGLRCWHRGRRGWSWDGSHIHTGRRMPNRDASTCNHQPPISTTSCVHITALSFPMALGRAQGGERHLGVRQGGGVCGTWLSSPKKISMRKKRQDQS